ncbi:hypothetical protein F5B21DRAFT_495052 [Xylaria acuta]|nr:hypothetical protein F5B21DRAFT_495052 [Xylaria acuta]
MTFYCKEACLYQGQKVSQVSMPTLATKILSPGFLSNRLSSRTPSQPLSHLHARRHYTDYQAIGHTSSRCQIRNKFTVHTAHTAAVTGLGIVRFENRIGMR